MASVSLPGSATQPFWFLDDRDPPSSAGICFGIGAKAFTSSVDVIDAIVKTFASRVFPLLLMSQFIAYFNVSNMRTVVAVNMADWLESADIGPLWLLIGFIFVILILDLIVPEHFRSGRSSPRSSFRCSSGSTPRRRPCSPPTGLVTRR